VRPAVQADRADGRRPFCVAAPAGTTGTGAVDPAGEACRPVRGARSLAARRRRLRRARGAVLAVPRGADQPQARRLTGARPRTSGCSSRTRSAASSCATPRLLERAFAIAGAYLRDTAGGAVDFRDRSIQLTRGARAEAVALDPRVRAGGLPRRGAHGIALAEHAELLLRQRPGWEIVTPAQLAIVCFRRDGDDALQTRIAAAIVADGYAAPTPRRWAGASRSGRAR
jgi:aromatic-L-amino-acid decarboxylase